MAGPGSIVTAMTFVSGKNWLHMGIVIIMFGAVCLLNLLIFRLSGTIVKRLGQNVIGVIGRIMGLIIAVIGTGMVLEGIRIAFNMID
jgi:multiple antibiotic resistance protein